MDFLLEAWKSKIEFVEWQRVPDADRVLDLWLILAWYCHSAHVLPGVLHLCELTVCSF